MVIRPGRLSKLAGDADSVRRTLGRALRRPGTYPAAARELLLAGVNVALYPAGLLGRDVKRNSLRASARGKFSQDFCLNYLDPEAAATPIILLHGYFHNRSAFVMMRRALRRSGFAHVETWNYNVIGNGVDELAKDLGRHIDAVLERTGSAKVHLVGHSLGGLIARSYIQEHGGDETVHTCITLGTPHAGTYTALIGRGAAARQLRPGSDLLLRLKATARPLPVRFVSYYSNLDALIVPASSAKLDEPALRATNVLMKDLGHMSMLISSQLIHSIAVALSGLAPTGAPEGTVALPVPPRTRRRNGKAEAEGA